MERELASSLCTRTTRLSLLLTTATLLTFCILGAAPAHSLDVTSCGTNIPEGQTGVLTTDLVCSSLAVGAFGVELEDRATLDLAGHTISGGIFGVTGHAQVNPRCRILSSAPGGAIVGTLFGISDCQKTEVSDLAVIGATMQAIGGPHLVLTNVTIRDGGEPITTASLTATNLVVTNNHGVMAMNRGTIRGLIATGNTGAVFSGGIGGTFFLRSFGPLRLTGATITGNTGVGVTGVRVTLKNSTVTGNNPTGDGIDLLTTNRPRLINSTCGRSAELNRFLGASWRVCANDPP
jgi:hypothetical protein